MIKFKKVALGISGGVDSAVAALLLKNKGYDVQAVFMQNWDIADEKGVCVANEDYKDAAVVCDKLNIKLYHVNFVKQYWNEVFCDLVQEYKAGNTPNPDILCNRHIKFNHFYDYAINNLKVDAIATGHYANTSFGPYLEHYQPDKSVRLMRAKDTRKDQTFFLCQIEQRALRRTMFPLSELTKNEVKRIAADNGLGKFAEKEESMGICFIGTRNFQEFIREYINDEPGDFINVDDGRVVSQHNGFHQWTLGQRSRIHSRLKASFIARKNADNNVIYLGEGTDHPILHSKLVLTSQPHWIHSQPQALQRNELLQCEFKFQHTQTWAACTLFETTSGLIVKLEQDKRALTPGQYAVFAKDNEVLGSARIVGAVTNFALHYFDTN